MRTIHGLADDQAELLEDLDAAEGKRSRKDASLNDFTQMVLANLKSASVHQAAKDDRISFTGLEGWPGSYIAAEDRFMEGETERRAAIFVGPEFGTVTRADLTVAAREALDARFDALIACGFNFDAHTSELTRLGPLPILKTKMNPDLHMSEELKNTGAGNLFVVSANRTSNGISTIPLMHDDPVTPDVTPDVALEGLTE